MNRRLAAITLGGVCVLGAGAGLASHYIGRDGARDAQPTPLFLTSAQQVEPRSWPPAKASVAFNEEMYALLTMGASAGATARQSASAAAREMDVAEPLPRMSRRERRRMQREERARERAERAFAREERTDADDRSVRRRDDRGRDHSTRDERGRVHVYGGGGDAVEVHVRDRRGVRVQRIEREPGEERQRTDPPSHFRVFGSW